LRGGTRTLLIWGTLSLLLLSLALGSQVRAAGNLGDLSLVWSRSDGHNATSWSVRWSPDGTMIAQTFFDNSTVVWNSTTGKRVVKLGSHENSTAEIRTRCDGNQTCAITAHTPSRVTAWSPDGKYLAVGGDDTIIWIFNTTDWSLTRKLSGHLGSVLTLDFSPDGKYLASGSGTDKVFMNNVPENLIKVWDFERGIAIANMTGHTDGVMEVKWSPDGGRLASASDDKTMRMWNTTDWSYMFTLRGHAGGVLAVDWSPDGAKLISGSRDYKMALWNASDGKQIAKWTAPNCVRSVDWHKDGDIIAASGVSEAMVMIRNATTGVVMQTLEDNKDGNGVPVGAIMSARWSPDGQMLAVASGREMTIRVYAFGLTKPTTESAIPGWVAGVAVFVSIIVAATLVTYAIMKRRLRRTERR
jgi:WD40 repeat protein